MVSIVPYSGGLELSHSMETARGAAISFLDRGADRIYLFNFFDDEPYGVTGEAYASSAAGKAFHGVMEQLGSTETMAGKSRRHVVSNERYLGTWTDSRLDTSPRDWTRRQGQVPDSNRPSPCEWTGGTGTAGRGTL